MGPIGAGAADQRAWNSIARSPSRSSIGAPACRAASLPARSEACKVERGVGSEAEADGVRAAACAPPRRQGGDARLNIKVDAPLWAPQERRVWNQGRGRLPHICLGRALP